MHSSMRSGFSSCKCMSTRSRAYWHFSSYVFGKLRRARSCSTVSRDFSMIFMMFSVHDAQELRQNSPSKDQKCRAQFSLEYMATRPHVERAVTRMYAVGPNILSAPPMSAFGG